MAIVRDPICDMPVGEQQAVLKGLATEHQGKVYYFCSRRCKRRFDRQPQYRGHSTVSRRVEAPRHLPTH